MQETVKEISRKNSVQIYWKAFNIGVKLDHIKTAGETVSSSGINGSRKKPQNILIKVMKFFARK